VLVSNELDALASVHSEAIVQLVSQSMVHDVGGGGVQ
jgi:hypothetical protein